MVGLGLTDVALNIGGADLMELMHGPAPALV
jgi:hypothetical protein